MDGTEIKPIENIVFSNFAVDYQKIFCCYGIKALDVYQNNCSVIDLFPIEALSGLGPYFVLVVNVGSFLDRFEKACEREKHLGFHYDFVDYVELSNDIYMRERDLFSACFSKDVKFSHQKEFRFAIPPSSSEDTAPKLLNIGKIDDIARSFHGVDNLKNAELNFSRFEFTFEP
ncbi:hypothetical protein [Wohlfahrtiimonas populi]|uniref:hypothetical protein n=1 Tax=Wohlfahrtiimonas populi TaxID=1940240 RepID=UPI00098D2D88|nr:hypothetical protein [Wohlfahrtiimonas populi]